MSIPYPNKAAAEAARVKLSFAKYPTQLGAGYVAAIKDWAKIVEASHEGDLIRKAHSHLPVLGLR